MSLFFFLFGALLLDSGVHGSAGATFDQLKADVSSFLAFGLVILILGGLGESTTLRPVSKALLGLVFVVFFLRNGQSMIANLKAFGSVSSASSVSSTTPTQSSGQSGQNYLSELGKAADIYTEFTA